jgi:hypothetical protein
MSRPGRFRTTTVPEQVARLRMILAVTRKDWKMKRLARQSVKAVASPKTGQRIMKRSDQRASVVASRTPLSSDTREVAVTFTSRTYQKLKLAADLNGVTISVMVRQCVQYLLDPSDA